MTVLNNYYFDNQIKRYVLQFMAIFASMKIQHDDGEFQTINVRYTSADRVSEAIVAGNTQNRPLVLPAFSTRIQAIEMAPQLRKGVGVTRQTVTAGPGYLPEDIEVINQKQPVPYILSMSVDLMATNYQHVFQLLEQIMMLFDPVLQIQTSDSYYDPTVITTVELKGFAIEDNVPMDTERRIIKVNMDFEFPIYISLPVNITNNLITAIKTNLYTVDQVNVNISIDDLDFNDIVDTIQVGKSQC